MGRLTNLIKYVWRDWRAGAGARMYGVYMFVGEVGEGKTLSAVNMIEEEVAKNPEVKVYTNFHYKYQDGEINHWTDMLEVPSFSIIALDEIQNTFDQRSWQSFPPQIVELLTQNRKWGSREEGRPPGVRLIMTTQDYENTDVFIRRLCNYVIQCRAFFKGRMIVNTMYRRKVYEQSETKRRNAGRKWFVGSDELRESYDTYRILESMKNYEKQEKLKVVVKGDVL